MKKTTLFTLFLIIAFIVKVNSQCEASILNSTTPTVAVDNSGNPIVIATILSNEYTEVTNLNTGDSYTVFVSESWSYPAFITIRNPNDNSVISSNVSTTSFIASTTEVEVHYFLYNTCSTSDFGIAPIIMQNNSTLSIEDVSSINYSVKIYPNPVVESLIIKSDTTIEAITISNLLGEIVYKEITNSKYINIDVAKMAGGIYIVNGITDNQKFSKKILKY